MKIIDAYYPSSYELASKEAAITLLKDGIVVYPTDTLYGLAVNALDEYTVEKLFRLKKRPETKPVPIMVSSIEMAKRLAFIDKASEVILKELWPGPYTFVFWKKGVVPKIVTAGGETVALRIADNQLVQGMINDFGGPITATSANISGEEPLTSAEEIVEIFSKQTKKPDLVLDAGRLPTSHPSAVIDLTAGRPKILRVNPTTKDRLLEVLKVLS